MGDITHYTIRVCADCGGQADAQFVAHRGDCAAREHEMVLLQEVEVVRADLHRGAVEAIREHRDSWVAANGTNPGNVRPRDAKLWDVVCGVDPSGGQ